MNRKRAFLIALITCMALPVLTILALAGYGDLSSPNYSLFRGFLGALGGQITSTNYIVPETRLEPFGQLARTDGLPGQWLPPVQVFTFTSAHPVIAFDGHGIMHAIWLESGGIGYATVPEGGVWSAITLVPDTAGAASADLSVSPSGDAHMAWVEGATVYYSFKPSGGAWQNSASAIPTGLSNARAPHLVVDAGGTVHAVWYDTATAKFRYNHKPRGGVWRDNILHDGNPVPSGDIPDPAYNGSDEFDIAMDQAGVLHLTWCSGDTCYHGQKDSYFWNSTIDTLGTGINLAAPDLTVDGAGGLHIAWASRHITTTGGGITYCAFENNSCATMQTWAAGRVTDAPSIAIDAQGQAQVVWHEGAPNGEIYYPRPTGVDSWLPPARLQFNLLGSHDPALAVGPSGVIHLVWGNQSLARGGLYYMHTDPAPWNITPTKVQVNASPIITITGHAFAAPTTVTVNDQTVTATVVNSTTITFNLPANLPGGWHNLTVSRLDGASNVLPRAVWVNVPTTPLVLEENIPTPYKAAFGVTVDPTGNTWFIEADSGATPSGGASPTKLFRIPYGQQLKIEVPLGGRNPSALVADTLGYIWLYEPATNRLLQMDPVSEPGQFIITKTFLIPTANAGVQAMAVAPATNDIWFVEGHTGQVGYLDYSAQSISDNIYAYDVDNLPTDLAIDRNGDVWFTLAKSSRIGRYNTIRGVWEYKTPTPNAQPTGITIDPHGHIWFAEYATGKIGRGDPALMMQNTANGITEYNTPTPNSCPYDIVADTGPDVGLGGRIWFTEKCTNQIGAWRAEGLTPGTVFTDNFSIGSGNWLVDSGTWAVNSGEYQGNSSGDFHAHISSVLSWQNYAFQARVKVVSGGSAGVSFRETDGANHYRAEIGRDTAGYGFARLGCVVAGNFVALNETNADILLNQFYTLRVEVNENVLRFYVDDRLVALAEDNTFGGGRAGLYGRNATASFDDVQITRYAYSTVGRFTEYPIPTAGSRPQDIAVRYDGGDVWFTERGTHKVGNLIRQADSTPARLYPTLNASGYWGDDPNPAYKLPWRSFAQSVAPINSYSITVQLAGLIDPNWESVERIVEFNLDGITYRDSGPNDKDKAAYSIIGMQSAAWHSRDSLNAVQQPIRVPQAKIDIIWPPRVQPLPENPVSGSGHGTSRNGNPIIAREWRSSRMPLPLSTGDSFGPMVLGEGMHLLSYRVAVTDALVGGQHVWSPEDAVRYRVNMRPIARFEMRGHGVQGDGSFYDVEEETLTLDGRGSYDPDGEVTKRTWMVDGNVLACTSAVCQVQNIPANHLGIGQHQISLKVTDNDGADSINPASKSLRVIRTPVIVVHGYSFTQSRAWTEITDFAEFLGQHEGYDYYGPFSSRGNVFISNYASDRIPKGDLRGYAQVLASEVTNARHWTGAEKVDIVAMSAGGVVSRWYTRFIDDRYVRKFIMVGTPNHGQDASVWAKGGAVALDFLVNLILDGVSGGTAPDVHPFELLVPWIAGRAAAQMEPYSDLLKTVNGNDKAFDSDSGAADSLAPGVTHYVINGDVGRVMSHGIWEIKAFGQTISKIWYPELHSGDGDWILVVIGSAHLNNVPSYGYPVKHEQLENDTRVRERIFQILSGQVQAYQAQAASSQDSRPRLPVYWSPSVLGTVTASGVYSYPVQIDSTTSRAHIKISFVDPDLSVQLQDPNGRLFQASSLRSPSALTVSKVSQTNRTDLEYTVERPSAGMWYVIISGNPRGESDQLYYASALMETTVGFGVGTDKQTYLSGETMHILAQARDVMTATMPLTLTNGIVIARVERPDGQVAALQLYDDGTHGDMVARDGLFANVYTDTTRAGAYNVSAAGQFAYNGETILRRASARAEVQADVQLALAYSYRGPDRIEAFALANTSPTAGEQTELAVRIRNSGRDGAKGVLVHFYDGNPAQGGVLIGETIVDIPAKSTVSARLPWLAQRGVHALYVVVDPYNFLMQRIEGGLEGAIKARMATSTRAAVQDTTPPVADPGPAITIPYSTTVRFDGLNSTDDVDVLTYTWQINLGGDLGVVTLDGPTPVLVGGVGIAGTYPVSLTVYDADGNHHAANTVLHVTDTPLIELPEVTSFGGAPAGAFNLRTLTTLRASSALYSALNVNEDEDVQFIADADSGPWGRSSYNCAWSVDRDNYPNQADLFGCRPILKGGYAQPGVYSAELRVTDMWGNGPALRTITITVNDATAPVIELGGINEDYWRVEPQLSFSGTVTDNVTVATVLVNGHAVSVTGDIFSATVMLNEGSNDLNVTARDSAGNTTVVTRSVRYTVLDHFVVSILESNLVAGQPFTASITAQDAASVTFSYTGAIRLDDTSGLLLPPQIQLVNGQWTGQLTLYAAQPVTVTASARNRTGEQRVSQVMPAAFDHVAIWPALVMLEPGQSRQLTAAGYDAYNNVITTSLVTNWSLANGGGVLSAGGLLTAGNLTGVYTDTIQVTVNVQGVSKTGRATLVVYASSAFAPNHTAAVEPGDAITYTHHLTNKGAVPDTFAVAIASTYPAWVTLLDTEPFNLEVNEAAQVRVRVAAPVGSIGLIDTTILTGTNSRTGNYAVVTDTTIVTLPVPGIPVLLAPYDGYITDSSTITFAWRAGTGGTPASYNVQVGDRIITTAATVSTTVLPVGVYTWTVRAYNVTGYSAWANVRTIEITETVPPPDSPILVSPPDGYVTTTQSVTLTWLPASSGASPTGYNVRLDDKIITTTVTTSSTILSVGDHTWTARAYNDVGYSAWAVARTIRITETVSPALPGAPVLLAPPDGTVTTTQIITFAWEEGDGGTPTSYNVQVNGKAITTTTTTSTTILLVGEYTWTVRAYNDAGYSDWAVAWTIEIVDRPGQHFVYLPVVLKGTP